MTDDQPPLRLYQPPTDDIGIDAEPAERAGAFFAVLIVFAMTCGLIGVVAWLTN